MTSTIQLVEERAASADVQRIYDEIREYFEIDFVPNIFKAMAHEPDALKAQWEGLKQADKELGQEKANLISLAVAVTNGCEY